MLPRQINIPKKQSFFIFGARGTGKSTLVKSVFSKETSHYINLLRAAEEDRFARNPDELISEVEGLPQGVTTVIIDEIQKIPKLLDIVHELIETTDKRFVLTGSSARKLKAGGANLLAGRAVERPIFPFSFIELGDKFDTEQCLRWGTLPGIFQLEDDEEKEDFLIAYTHIYLKEEVWAEHMIRKLDPFRKFLEVAAQSNGKIVNFSNIAKDTGVDSKTIKSYYQVVEDTLLGFFLESYSPSVRKAVYKTPKFYFFDVGVVRALSRYLDVLPKEGTRYYGDLFEHLVITEIYKQLTYSRKQYRLFYIRTQADNEIDLIVERPGKSLLLIEVKSTKNVTRDKVKKMMMFRDEFPDAEFYVFSQDRTRKKYDYVVAEFWKDGVGSMFGLA